jgi:hypothetical protein
MGRDVFISALLAVVTLLLTLSCEEKTTTSVERTDFEAIKAIIYENPDIFLADVFDTDKDTLVDPIFFREISSRDFDLDSARRYQADSSHLFDYIHAAWGDSIRGVLHYWVDGKEYTKSIYAHAVTGAYFEQWGDVLDPHRGWLLKKISGNVIVSADTTSRQLYTLHINSSRVDTVLNEIRILTPVKKDSTMYFGMGEKVTFTIDPKDTTDHLFLHIGEHGRFQKSRFNSNGDGTFSASWTTTDNPDIAKGYKHAFVEAISRVALSDTSAKYDSKSWGVIYRIR